jgi:hypothetical protein
VEICASIAADRRRFPLSTLASDAAAGYGRRVAQSKVPRRRGHAPAAGAEGRTRHHQSGEGGYEECEKTIQPLLGDGGREDFPEDLADATDEGVEAQARFDRQEGDAGGPPWA